MLIPSIDLMGGQTVQLVGGVERAIEAGDPRPIAERFRLAGEMAIIDLDAALGQGSNAELIAPLLSMARCRVGGGIRDAETALRWLDLGADKVILGTKAVPEILAQLPRWRTIAAVDATNGEVVIDGWRTRTGRPLLEVVKELVPFVGGFLITFVEREGRMQGTAIDELPALVEAAYPCRVTFAGGITRAEEITYIDALGADAQVGMALYTGALSFESALLAPLQGDGPWPTVIVDRRGVARDLVMTRRDELAAAIADPFNLRAIDMDAQRGALRFTVDVPPAPSSWGPPAGLSALEHTLLLRRQDAPEGSYTKRLYDDPELLRAKLLEEAGELADAREIAHVAEEAADLVYFAAVAVARAGGTWTDVEAVLDRRGKRVIRRPGDAKP